jgi:2,3-diketo-5-methylthio-1-phosphopentane phosphatase
MYALDFDGTIFMQDTGHILFNNFGCGNERRAVLDHQIHSGERTFRDVSEEMWGSLDIPFEDGFEVMKDALDIDPDFKDFHEFCINNKIPFNVISAGLKPVLRRVLDHFLGEEQSANIDIVANDATISEDGSEWKVIWKHDTPLGHDKALSITEYRRQAKIESEDGTVPLVIFIGDGVSDLPAARQADVLFARRGLRLEEYCIENKLPYIPFDTFADIQREVIKIARIDQAKTGGEGLPATFNPRANMWRRASSKGAGQLFAMLSPKNEKMFVWPDVFSQLSPAVEKASFTTMASLQEKATVAEPAAC